MQAHSQNGLLSVENVGHDDNGSLGTPSVITCFGPNSSIMEVRVSWVCQPRWLGKRIDAHIECFSHFY